MSTKDIKKELSQRQEKYIAEFLSWSRVSGSGARFNKGDITSERWIGECKTHVAPNHKVEFQSKVWSKICIEGYSTFKWPAYFSDDGSQLLHRTWVLVPPLSVIDPEIHILSEDSKIQVLERMVFKNNISFFHEDLDYQIIGNRTRDIVIFEVTAFSSLRSDPTLTSNIIYNGEDLVLTRLDEFQKILEYYRC